MPKILPELRQRFLAAARKRVLDGESHDLTIRQIAADCHTAVGTVYNYFPSKEMLLAAVMMEDWRACLAAMHARAAEAEDALSALRGIEEALFSFVSLFSPTWRHYGNQPKAAMEQLTLRYGQVLAAIAQPVEAALRRFDRLFDPALPSVMAEMILSASREEKGFDRIAPILRKLLA